jgi:SAM-dependent methyltransferase
MKKDFELFAYEALRAFSLTHNYNRWIYEIYKPFLGKRVLEVGCGIGNMSQYLSKSCDQLIGIDTSSSFLNHLKIDSPELELHKFDITQDEVLSLADRGIDTVVCINVLEHIENDERALKNMFHILSPGGYVLLFVPALNFLYGSMDRQVGHYRRYSRKELMEKVEKAGFTVEKCFYSNMLGSVGWFINGRILRRKNFPILQPLIFDKLIPLLSFFEQLIKPWFGMTVMLIARKKA